MGPLKINKILMGYDIHGLKNPLDGFPALRVVREDGTPMSPQRNPPSPPIPHFFDVQPTNGRTSTSHIPHPTVHRPPTTGAAC